MLIVFINLIHLCLYTDLYICICTISHYIKLLVIFEILKFSTYNFIEYRPTKYICNTAIFF